MLLKFSQIFIDLSQDALVLRKPAVSRYVMFQIMNAWSDTVAILGTGGDTDDEQTYLLTGPNYSGEIPSGMTQIKIPTRIAWLIGRVICYDPDDIGNVYKIQEKMDVRLWLYGNRAASFRRANMIRIMRALPSAWYFLWDRQNTSVVSTS